MPFSEGMSKGLKETADPWMKPQPRYRLVVVSRNRRRRRLLHSCITWQAGTNLLWEMGLRVNAMVLALAAWQNAILHSCNLRTLARRLKAHLRCLLTAEAMPRGTSPRETVVEGARADRPRRHQDTARRLRAPLPLRGVLPPQHRAQSQSQWRGNQFSALHVAPRHR